MKQSADFKTLNDWYAYLESISPKRIKAATIRTRIMDLGWSVEDAVTKPLKTKPDNNHPYKREYTRYLERKDREHKAKMA